MTSKKEKTRIRSECLVRTMKILNTLIYEEGAEEVFKDYSITLFLRHKNKDPFSCDFILNNLNQPFDEIVEDIKEFGDSAYICEYL